MRILKKEEALEIDINYIYRRGNAIAILSADFDKRFDITKKTEPNKDCATK